MCDYNALAYKRQCVLSDKGDHEYCFLLIFTARYCRTYALQKLLKLPAVKGFRKV